ncbi:MAG: hypothetical protein Q8Q09_24815 [Deltaproteobacteria bacterium]|nr:hypothetical protein [Deltaproteobacteria bacterium]
MSSRLVLLTQIASAVALSACTGAAPQQPMYDVTEAEASWGEAGPPMGALWSSSSAPETQGVIIPAGFFARVYARIASPRSMSVAPNGDLFVTSPARGTPGGEGGGMGEIVVLSDDDRDGNPERHTFATGLADVHSVAVRQGFVYFTTGATLWRTPYTVGLRAENPAIREQVLTYPTRDDTRWTHGVDVRSDGTVFSTVGVWGVSRACTARVNQGEILRVNTVGMPAQPLVTGLRNPLYVRCHPSQPLCLAAELGDDGGATWGALEKILSLDDAMQDVGFPCCVTQGRETPFNGGAASCANVTPGVATFPLSDTPFGMDWEPGVWPHPFNRSLFVALHGSFYSTPRWAGARVVFGETDAQGRPVGRFNDFVVGFGPSTPTLRRPADIAFAGDGRMYLADDRAGLILWIAPSDLRRH